jgi:hypothetical protein
MRTIKTLFLLVLIMAMLLAPMAMAQVQVVNYRYTPNQNVEVLQYHAYNAPAIRTIPAGQSITLFQPFVQDGLFYYAPINAQNNEWVLFASAANCDMVSFGTLSQQ